MLVLVNSITMLKEYITFLPPQAIDILERAENPTTIIYPGAQYLADNLLAPDGSIGIRISSDPFCKRLIEFTGCPLVSTSANISSENDITSYKDLKIPVDFIVKGECKYGQSSTVVDLVNKKVLRQGVKPFKFI